MANKHKSENGSQSEQKTWPQPDSGPDCHLAVFSAEAADDVRLHWLKIVGQYEKIEAAR